MRGSLWGGTVATLDSVRYREFQVPECARLVGASRSFPNRWQTLTLSYRFGFPMGRVRPLLYELNRSRNLMASVLAEQTWVAVAAPLSAGKCPLAGLVHYGCDRFSDNGMRGR